ncbi:MAG: bifunctional folylpolyglutamate synthase/dihydrofolate synthase [Lachnospiraceae bacterium]|nr:bifunctional folylpolyglutamate synthase/dihydrofolate synthase [Lachnospiraceae bacterium]
MTYEEAREYLNHASKKGIVMGLTVMEELMKRLHHPEQNLPIVHIAGTNGKGSILAYLEQIFLKAGYRTGRYVSPALGAYENRFLIDGKGMDAEKIPGIVEQVKNAADQMEAETGLTPTVFELETAMAFLAFFEAGSQVVLLETGMGGRLDGTNVIKKPLLSIIASVSMDHMQVLGSTLSEIAAEKAGIIKAGCDVLLYPMNPEEVNEVIRNTSDSKKSDLYKPDIRDAIIIEETEDGAVFSYKSHKNLKIFLPGGHQIYNAVTAVEASHILKKWYHIEDEHIKEGLKSTRWSGRLEKISERPAVYLDGAHNEDAAKRLAEFMRKHFQGKRILAVTGVLADKEYEKMMELVLPMASKTAVITPENPRALKGSELLKTVEKYCPDCFNAGNIVDGFEWAKKEAGKEDVVILFGSLSFHDQLGGYYGTIS